MNKDIKVSDDVLISLVEQEGNLLLTIIVQDGYRETRSINLIDEEVTKLCDFLNKGVENPTSDKRKTKNQDDDK